MTEAFTCDDAGKRAEWRHRLRAVVSPGTAPHVTAIRIIERV